mmetsp:Transcript_13196/g.40637  ORF Transcript_13196/g.40637 Transcript_13196/m.40637 type:complete len:345 (-) Transcript_13196:1120-2154(-)
MGRRRGGRRRGQRGGDRLLAGASTGRRHGAAARRRPRRVLRVDVRAARSAPEGHFGRRRGAPRPLVRGRGPARELHPQVALGKKRIRVRRTRLRASEANHVPPRPDHPGAAAAHGQGGRAGVAARLRRARVHTSGQSRTAGRRGLAPRLRPGRRALLVRHVASVSRIGSGDRPVGRRPAVGRDPVRKHRLRRRVGPRLFRHVARRGRAPALGGRARSWTRPCSWARPRARSRRPRPRARRTRAPRPARPPRVRAVRARRRRGIRSRAGGARRRRARRAVARGLRQGRAPRRRRARGRPHAGAPTQLQGLRALRMGRDPRKVEDESTGRVDRHGLHRARGRRGER